MPAVALEPVRSRGAHTAAAISKLVAHIGRRSLGIPLLGCLLELLPWLKQWHNDIDVEYGVRMGDYFEGFVHEESRNLLRVEGRTGWTVGEIQGWEAVKRRTTNRPRSSKRKDGQI